MSENQQVTTGAIEALSWLRNDWDGSNTEYAIEAFNVLDNAGFFRPIDEVTGYDVSPELLVDRARYGTEDGVHRTIMDTWPTDAAKEVDRGV